MYNQTSPASQFFQPSAEAVTLRILAHSPNPIWEVFILARNENGEAYKTQDGSRFAVKPYRSSIYPTDVTPAVAGESPQAVYYHLIYNETANLLQVWGVKQKTVLSQLQEIKGKCGDKPLKEVTIIASRKGTKKDDTTYLVIPHTDRKGAIEFSPVPTNVQEFYDLVKSNGDVTFSLLLSNEYPLQGIALLPVPTELKPASVTNLLAATTFEECRMVAMQLLAKIDNNGEIVEDGVSYSRDEITNILDSKAL
jgi:hypothetical protein